MLCYYFYFNDLYDLRINSEYVWSFIVKFCMLYNFTIHKVTEIYKNKWQGVLYTIILNSMCGEIICIRSVIWIMRQVNRKAGYYRGRWIVRQVITEAGKSSGRSYAGHVNLQAGHTLGRWISRQVIRGRSFVAGHSRQVNRGRWIAGRLFAGW